MGTPILFYILGGSEFRLRQGFAAQNAWNAPFGASLGKLACVFWKI